MPKLLVFSDLHILEASETIIGLYPASRFSACLTHALQHHGDAEGIVLLGDLTHDGKVEQYEILRDLVADLSIPIHYLMGNHDNRDVFRSVFPDVPVDRSGYIQKTISVGDMRLICVDTLAADKPPFDAGFLTEDRMVWLRNSLEENRDHPTIVAQHHPPMAVGFDGMDDIRLTNGEEELLLLSQFPNVHLVLGHIHRAISGQARGVPFTVLKSPCHQMPLILGRGSSGLSIDEPGAYGIILLHDGNLVVHSQDVGLAKTDVGLSSDPR